MYPVMTAFNRDILESSDLTKMEEDREKFYLGREAGVARVFAG